MTVILFEDPQVLDLYPVSVGKAAFLISCGSRRLVDQVAALGQPVRAVARPYLGGVLEVDFPELLAPNWNPNEPLLLVNARLAPSVAARKNWLG